MLVRVVHDEYKQLLGTVAECRQERYFDVVYCWTKLVAAHAFRHVAQCKCVLQTYQYSTFIENLEESYFRADIDKLYFINLDINRHVLLNVHA